MFSSIKMNSRIAVLAIAAVLGTSAQAAEITGAGASFVFPAMSKWSADYNAATGHRVNYQSTVDALIWAMPPPEPMDW